MHGFLYDYSQNLAFNIAVRPPECVMRAGCTYKFPCGSIILGK